MDVLNPSPALCLPQTMWLTYQVIMTSPGLGPDEVIAMVVPEGLASQTQHGKRALSGLRDFRLVQQDESGALSAESIDGASQFVRLLRRRAVVAPSDEGPDYVGAPDLRAGLVWLMRQAPMLPLDYDTVQTEATGNPFVNDTRWNGFRLWSQALGFSRPALAALSKNASQRAKIVPDPTEAVIDAIRAPFGDPLPRGEQLPIGELLSFLRAELPVLPGHPSATYDGMAADDESSLRVLGLALSSAEQRGVLTMAYQSDPSGVMALPDAQDFGRSRYVSTVTVKG
ncbi:hypothetical protein [Microbacterium sp. CPCC 204701]|uniref:hypothetical protein n=1 Tax=Microbacterium sp. CPCC 204701 TaxID=2493084 RepID=UPI000FD997DA|nr:hypothetical protein [Microbacterium sp. CPCC 204701]